MRTCLFCSNTDLSREHLWPDWVVEFFKANLPANIEFQATKTERNVVVNSWKQNSITQKVRLVCEHDCNNGWMSTLEGLSKPILLPMIADSNFPLHLNLDRQETIALWMTSRSMVLDALTPPTYRYYTQLERQTFATTFQVPANTHVWLAPYPDGGPNAQFGVINRVPEVAKDRGIHVLVCLMHHVVLQLFTWKGCPTPVDFARMQRDGWDRFTRRVWPARKKGINWPSSHHLSLKGFESFANRLSPPDVTPLRLPYRTLNTESV